MSQEYFDSEKAFTAAEREQVAANRDDQTAKGVFYRGYDVHTAFRAYTDAEFNRADDLNIPAHGFAILVGHLCATAMCNLVNSLSDDQRAEFKKQFFENVIGTCEAVLHTENFYRSRAQPEKSA